MPRTEYEIMTGWEFALNKLEEQNFKPITLPHDWAINAPFHKEMKQGAAQGYRERWGKGWYRKKVKLSKKKKGYRYYLDFGAVYENCTVWINDKNVGGWKYGYSSFRLDITEEVETGDNQIFIEVDNTVAPVDRWYSGCGIYRTVKWIEAEEKHLDEREIVVTTTLKEKNAYIFVDTGTSSRVKASLKLWEKAETGIKYEEEAENGVISFQIENAKLWSAEEPNLYLLSVSLIDGEREADKVEMRIGIREIAMIANQGMYVNGKKVILKGVCLHQEAGCCGIAVKKEIWRERLLTLKEMGCNSIRAAHHTHSEEFLDLCDEIGFYVYEECFDKWTAGLYGRYFDTQWKLDVEAMVKRDRNRACIFIWGVGNEVENQAQASMLVILKMLKEYILTMDSTRPITYAMNPHFKRESMVDVSKIEDIQQFVDEADDTEIYDTIERVERIKKIAEIVDVISCNYQEQWYSLIHEMIPDKLILGTEIFQYFMGHSEQMQNFTDKNPSLIPYEYNYCIGGMIWTGYDYLGESMGYPAKGWSGAMLRTNNERRPSYYIMQSYWSEKPMVHFAVMDYSLSDEGVKEHWDTPIYAEHWHFPQFHKTVIPYIISSNCDEVRLYLNEKRYYLPKPADCLNHIISGFLPYQPGTVEVVGYLDGVEVCRNTTVTPDIAVKLEFDKKIVKLPMEEGYQMLLTVRAKDEAGVPYFRESSLVRFRTEGPVRILAVDSGNLMSSEPYNEEFIHMYHGCASVLVALTGEKARAVVWADTDGMSSASCVISYIEV
ncbi:glycoside hydrolase family 2 TIM barrel-domain containing protein [Konateibacter massiliensis]|uniref:glycoside hydrolase family 2 TIM barrel-domain containing protein n=1 Tax=Konateibacter massiliensis TaxID=2002841 RepID=UPI000C155204|nr:glycoside hydrolase family 2 TIM barrel-domain containing protein [Konateibacter massiliensis]